MKRKKVLALIMAAAMTFGSVSTAFAMDADQYKDVQSTQDFFKYVEDVVDLKIMEGETADEFGVEEDVTREDVVSYMYRLMKSPTVNGSLAFSDVVGKDFADAVIWADKENLFEGMREGFFEENNFSAETGVTRAEMCQLMKNLADKLLKIDVKEDVAENLDDYEDSKDVQAEYTDAVKWAVGNELLAEREDAEGKLLSNEIINKVETAEFLSKLMDMVEDDTVDIVDKDDVKDTVATKPNNSKKPAAKPANPSKNESNKQENNEQENDEKDEATHEHTWVDKQHEEEGHWEDKLVKEAWEETIEHEEEGHTETVVIQPEYEQEIPVSAEIGHSERVTVVDKEAWTEEIQHEAETHEEWVVDKEAWVEEVEHAEEGHYENGKLLEQEQGHYETIHHEAEYKTVHHEAEYKTVHHEAEYKHHDAEYKTVHHEEEGHWDIVTRCSNCGTILTSTEEAVKHLKDNFLNGCTGYANHEEWVVDKAAWDEQVLVKEAWDELIKEAWDEQVLVKEAWDEQVLVKEAWDEDYWVVDKEAVYEQVWVVDKEAWTETINHPEEGHYETVVDKEAWVEKIEHPAETHEEFQWVVDVPAVTEIKKIPAVTEDRYVVDKEAWTETVKHEAEYEKVWVVDKEAYTEKVCSGCGELKDKKNKK